METGEEPTPKLSLKDRLSSPINFLKIIVRKLVGTSEVRESEDGLNINQAPKAENRQLVLKQRILDNLTQKGIVASEEENFEFYAREFHVSGYSSPEVFRQLPGGAVALDKNQQNRIYLNPFLHLSNPDYQLVAVLEEAIHYYQIKHNKHGRDETGKANMEVAAKEKIIKIADFLGLSNQSKEFVKSLEAAFRAQANQTQDSIQ